VLELEALRARKVELTKELATLADYDPEVLRALNAKVKIAKAGADRWTDALLTLRGWLIKTWGKAPKEADAMLQLPEDFDYVT
jgi:hypothetical protein